MTATDAKPETARLIAALSSGNSSTRLQAALAMGTSADHAFVDSLINRCGIEPDFYVRDMLTWALIRFPAATTVPKLLLALNSERSQARSQALHTLSKIKDPGTWSAITQSLLRDADDEVAQSAWRAAVVLVPCAEKKALAEELALQFGRGNREMQQSLSLALVVLGAEVAAPVIENAKRSEDPGVKAHAGATEQLLRDPNAGFQFAVDQVKVLFAPGQ